MKGTKLVFGIIQYYPSKTLPRGGSDQYVDSPVMVYAQKRKDEYYFQ